MGTTITEGAATWLPFFLQTADALFPTGAYAHSLGFEEGVRLGLARDEGSLGRYLGLHIVPALREQELAYLRFAFECSLVTREEVQRLAHPPTATIPLLHLGGGKPPHSKAFGSGSDIVQVDREISAWKIAAETRSASLQLGQRRLKALRTISDAPILEEYEGLIREGEAEGHHLVVCALQAYVGGVPLLEALTAYAYQALAAICAAAMKLMRMGQEACQRVLAGAAAQVGAAVEASLKVERESAGWFDPLLEIASMRHELAEERLFIS
jgi:urease accessory protein